MSAPSKELSSSPFYRRTRRGIRAGILSVTVFTSIIWLWNALTFSGEKTWRQMFRGGKLAMWVGFRAEFEDLTWEESETLNVLEDEYQLRSNSSDDQDVLLLLAKLKRFYE